MVIGSGGNIGRNIPSYLFCSYENHVGTSNSVKLYIFWTISGVGAIREKVTEGQKEQKSSGVK